jgi:hypothetical protein
MMQLLSERICKITGGKALSVLYSDIGPDFYDKNGGWKAYDAVELLIPSGREFGDTLSADMLNLKDAEVYIDEDVKKIKNEFVDGEDGEDLIFQLLPQYEELDWASVRDRHLAKHLKLQEQENFGAKVTSVDGWGYVLWFHEYQSFTLTILRMREPPTDAGMRGLLQAALSEARQSGLENVKIWSPSERLENLTGVKRDVRKDAIPSLRYFGEHEKVRWRYNEALGWC